MKKKQKAEPESRRKSSYKGNSRNNSKSGGLTFSEKKRLIQLKHILSGKSIEKEKPTTAQRTITFEKMFRDGICQVSHRYYTKMVEFFDINYELLEVDDQADILAQYSKLINYFDPSVRFELVLFNRQVNEQMLTEQFDIPWQEDDFNDIREEYTEMLKKQAAKGNNGIINGFLINALSSDAAHDQYLLFHNRKETPIHSVIQSILCEYYAPQICSDKMIDAYMIVLFCEILRQYRSQSFSPKAKSQWKIVDILDYLEANYLTVTLQSTADHFGFHPNYLSAFIKKETGRTFKELVILQKNVPGLLLSDEYRFPHLRNRTKGRL